MILKYLSAMCMAIAPALGNHLWQSTLFAVAAGLLVLFLRKYHARARYGVWLAASLKFLIPFSLLAGIGSHLAWSRSSAGTNSGLYFAMEEVSQPFTQPATSMISRTTPSTVSSKPIQLLSALLAAVWLCGFVIVVSVWYLRWGADSGAITARARSGRTTPTGACGRKAEADQNAIVADFSGTRSVRHYPARFGMARRNLRTP